MADPAAPTQKRPRLDSVNTVYNGHGLPQHPPPPTQSTRPSSYPTPTEASSPPSSRAYPPQSLPPPPQSYPPQGQAPYSVPQPSPSLPSSDIRILADPRNIPDHRQRPHGVPGPSMTVPQDSIATYRYPPTPRSSTAPDLHSSRSTSISVDVKPPPGMEHAGHQSPWASHPEHRSNGSISNGYAPTISPTLDQGFHPPPPPGQQYGQAAVPYAAASPYNMAQFAAQGQAAMRRKQVRATQACNHCRARKQKCDEARPCQFCRENHFDCLYKDVPPPKQDRSMMQLQDSVDKVQDILNTFCGEMGLWKQSVDSWKQSVESRLASARGPHYDTAAPSSPANYRAPIREHSTSGVPTPSQAPPSLSRADSLKKESSAVASSHMSPGTSQTFTAVKKENQAARQQSPWAATKSSFMEASRENQIALEEMAQEDKGLQSNHTTPAHRLLEDWNDMRDFHVGIGYLERLKARHILSDYPMQLEQSRGIIRVWGVGEGQDLNDGGHGPGSPEGSNESDAPSPAVAGKDSLWGHPPLDHSSPNSMSGSTPREHLHREGGLGADGRPNFQADELRRLVDSYVRSMHVFHPFLNLSKLERMLAEFVEQYSPGSQAANSASPANFQLNPGVKRKRSSSGFGESYTPKGAIEHSLRNAILLLVFALGKVCLHKTRLRGPQSDKGSSTNGAWGSARDSPGLNVNGSFNSDISDDSRPRNVDILPGMAYFAYATDILGNQQGGHTIAHAQANILASLYLGQFARVLESWSWIQNACRIVMVLVKNDFNGLRRSAYNMFGGKANQGLSSKEKYRLNLILCAYWACLQLESDMVAELSTLPISGITSQQSLLMYPAGVVQDAEDETTGEVFAPAMNTNDEPDMMIYSSQIWLRTLLNTAHNALYGASGGMSVPTINVKDAAERANFHIECIGTWRFKLPPALQWKDTDAPTTDLNLARLRAKYYGAVYMILRSYLRIATQHIQFPPVYDYGEGDDANYEDPKSISRHAQMVDLSPDQRELVTLASTCIDAAIQSTIAFDRVGAAEDSAYSDYRSTRKDRLVLTNIFGTLHAQFGNMLVLAAVYRSPLYRHLPRDTKLTKRNLSHLYERTFQVLEDWVDNSPILDMDLKILRNVHRKLGLTTVSHI